MHTHWLDTRGTLLAPAFPLPLHLPFTTQQAFAAGVSRHTFAILIRAGLLRRVLRGVYVATQAPNDTMTRARALELVLPPSAVVVDRTAAWLHGVDILPRTAVVSPPPLEVVHMDDTRVRRSEVAGYRRGLIASDITNVYGVQVTTALRTALDLGRLLWRHDALAAIDGFLRIGVPQDLLIAEIGRFRGFRGVRQLRHLAPLGDARSESPGESGLRLYWHDAGLPRPVLQLWILDDAGVPIFRLDIADDDVCYAAEYDGEQHHTRPGDQEHDAKRREWIAANRRWVIDPFTKHDVYGRGGDAVSRLQQGYAEARRGMSLWTPGRRTA